MMSSVRFDAYWGRDVGPGVPSTCDHPDCSTQVGRGTRNLCGNVMNGVTHGCGLFFCFRHTIVTLHHGNLCERCAVDAAPFKPKPDTKAWLTHKITHVSWLEWRQENPELVQAIIKRLEAIKMADQIQEQNYKHKLKEHEQEASVCRSVLSEMSAFPRDVRG